jgi:hypothetical protein
MKTLTPIAVGDFTVAIEVSQPRPESAVLHFSATCGSTSREGKMSLHPKHDRAQEHLENDIQEFALRLAHETAGHEQSRLLLAKLMSNQ